MKSEQIIHSLAVGPKSIQSRVFDRETDEVISFVKIPIADSGLVRCEKGTREMNNEPVAIRYDFDGYGYKYMDSGSGSDWQTRVRGELLYTAPPQRKPLTDEQINQIADEFIVNYRIPAGSHYDFAKAIEAAHGIKE